MAKEVCGDRVVELNFVDTSPIDGSGSPITDAEYGHWARLINREESRDTDDKLLDVTYLLDFTPCGGLEL